MLHRGAQLAAPLVVLLGLLACSGGDNQKPLPDTTAPPATGSTLFTLLPSSYTGVDFTNRVTDTRDFNIFTYRNYYNGGGVALGDLTGDGLPEIVLTSNEDGPK